MTIQKLHHVSIVVTDVERSRRFYEEVLRMTPTLSPSTFPFQVAWYQLGDQHLHLLAQTEADSISPRHYALWIDDARAWREHFNALGVEVSETVSIPGADRFFVNDPDGNLIEMIEWQVPWPQGDPEARTLPPLES